MSDLKTYLASKYMSGPKADAILARSTDPTIKKKRKKIKNEDYIGGSASGSKGESSGTSGLVFRDEADEWERRRREEHEGDDEDAPVVGKALATFKKSKSQWNTVSGQTTLPVESSTPDPTAGENGEDGDGAAQSEAPAAIPAKQLTKRKGGLRTAAQVQEEAARLAAEAAAKSPEPERDPDLPDPTETVHRDASGRVMDVKKLKEEARLREEEEKRKEREKEEWTKGFVQRKQAQERRQEEREMATQDVGRSVNDVRMNREMREVERWNDPAAEFLSKKKKRGPKRPKYTGSFAPNRFHIVPGFRWDGVDRSNGFEAKFFQYQNAAVRKEYESNQWSVEDM